MLSQRVKAALIFVPLVLILIYIGGWLFNIFITGLLLFAAFEFTRLFQRMGYQPSFLTTTLGIVLIVVQRWFFKDQYLGLFLTLFLLLIIIIALIEYERGMRDTAINYTINLMISLYLGWVGSHFILIRALQDGLGWLLTALLATWLADCSAYFIGRWFGKGKMTPQISPRKTWTGLLAGIATGTLSGLFLVILLRVIGFLAIDTPPWQGLIIGLVVSILTPVGDLFVSLFKRTAGVKDTGNLIPGHGGILDRIDTWIWAGMLGYYIVIIFNRT